MKRFLVVGLLASCVPTTFVFSPTSRAVTAKPAGCKIEILTSPPERSFDEVGTLKYYNGTEPKTLDAFRDAVAKRTCEVGGDAVIAIADNQGLYTEGTVIAYSGSGAPAPVRKGSAPPPPEQQHDNELPKSR